jgi:hypothetical protein
MRPQLALAVMVFGIIGLFSEQVSAGQVLAVASNGKWDMEYELPYGNLNALAAKAIAACQAKGGINPVIVWSQAVSLYKAVPRLAHGAIAVSDAGTGSVVGWSFNRPYQNAKVAKKDCQRKGGQNPKIVAKF